MSKTGTLTSVLIPQNTDLQICGPNPKRTRLEVHTAITTVVFVRYADLDVSAAGLPLVQNNSPIVLTKADHGDLIEQAWVGRTANVGGGRVFVLECFD